MRSGQTSTMPPDLETGFVCKGQNVRRVLIQLAAVGRKLLSTFSDMTAYWQGERRNRAHNEMLDMVAKGEPLFDILHTILISYADMLRMRRHEISDEKWKIIGPLLVRKKKDRRGSPPKTTD